MPNSTYDLFTQAMVEGKQVPCTYNGYHRELCPIILGHSQGQEKALTYQFAGESESRLPPGGDWKCLFLEKVTGVQLRDGGAGLPLIYMLGPLRRGPLPAATGCRR